MSSPTVLRYKIKKDGPYEFALDVLDNKIIVFGVFEGGIIYKHGGIKPGDELLEVNGNKLNAQEFTKCIYLLESVIEDDTSDFIEFKLLRDSKYTNLDYKFEFMNEKQIALDDGYVYDEEEEQV